GFERGATFLRCVGQGTNQEPHEFPAFCAKALAGIALDQHLPDTVQDRALVIELIPQPKKGREGRRGTKLRKRRAGVATKPIRDALEAWASLPGVIEALKNVEPEMPDGLNDRQEEICEPLIAIADLAGGEWPQKARSALMKLCANVEEVDIGVKLLGAIKG